MFNTDGLFIEELDGSTASVIKTLLPFYKSLVENCTQQLTGPHLISSSSHQPGWLWDDHQFLSEEMLQVKMIVLNFLFFRNYMCCHYQ